MSQPRRKVGFIGLGNMGRPMATNLLKADYELAVYDVKEERCKELGLLGATICCSNKDVAGSSDIIITVLPSSKEVREAILGENGLAEGLNRGQILVEMSSIESEAILEVAREVEAKGCHVIDAAISGVEEHAEKRELLIMAAGQREVFDSCADILGALGKAVVYVGDLGSAKAVKMATAALAAINIMGATEVVAWALKRGLDPKLLLEVVKQVPGHAQGSAKVIEKIVEGRFKRRPSWMPKDVGFGLKSAGELRVPMPFTALAHQMFMVAKALGLDGYEVTGIACKVYEAISGIELTPED